MWAKTSENGWKVETKKKVRMLKVRRGTKDCREKLENSCGNFVDLNYAMGTAGPRSIRQSAADRPRWCRLLPSPAKSVCRSRWLESRRSGSGQLASTIPTCKKENWLKSSSRVECFKFQLTALSQYAFISFRSGVWRLILNWTTALSWPSTFKLMCSDSPPCLS